MAKADSALKCANGNQPSPHLATGERDAVFLLHPADRNGPRIGEELSRTTWPDQLSGAVFAQHVDAALAGSDPSHTVELEARWAGEPSRSVEGAELIAHRDVSDRTREPLR